MYFPIKLFENLWTNEEIGVVEGEIQAFLASLESLPSYSEGTRAAYASDLRIFLEHLRHSLDRLPVLDDFNSAQVTCFLEAEYKDGRQHSTLLRRRATLLCFERYLLSVGILDDVRLKEEGFSIDLPCVSQIKETPVCLTDEQVICLLSILEQSPRPLARRDYAILAVLVETGFSASAIRAVNLSELDLRAHKIHLKSSADEDCWLPLGNAQGPVELYLKEGRPELNHLPDEPALFISQNGVRMSRQSIWQVMRHWGKAAGLPVLLSPRVIRHTAARRMVRAGRSIPEIQILLGHSNPLSTLALLNRLEEM